MSTPITQTGIKGFLLWFQREQPALYNKIAPTLPTVAPKAFGSYLVKQKNLRQLYMGKYARRVAMHGFADYSSDTLPTLYVSAPSIPDPVTVNYTSQLTAPISYDSSSIPLSTSAVSTLAASPIANAANTGSIASSVANAIAQTVGAASKVYMTNTQAAQQQSVVASQLARASAGLPPLNTSLNQLGVPTVSTGGSISSSTLMIVGGAALLAILLSSGGKSK